MYRHREGKSGSKPPMSKPESWREPILLRSIPVEKRKTELTEKVQCFRLFVSISVNNADMFL